MLKAKFNCAIKIRTEDDYKTAWRIILTKYEVADADTELKINVQSENNIKVRMNNSWKIFYKV